MFVPVKRVKISPTTEIMMARTSPVLKIVIRFEFDDEAGIVPTFECLTCGDLLIQHEGWWWNCPACDYELTLEAAQEVVAFASSKLSGFPIPIVSQSRSKEIVRGSVVNKPPWPWLTWLLRLLRLKGV